MKTKKLKLKVERGIAKPKEEKNPLGLENYKKALALLAKFRKGNTPGFAFIGESKEIKEGAMVTALGYVRSMDRKVVLLSLIKGLEMSNLEVLQAITEERNVSRASRGF